jgi:hypothetical protein
MIQEYWDAIPGLFFIMGAEGPVHVAMRDEYALSFTNGIDQYPRTIEDTVEKMSQCNQMT